MGDDGDLGFAVIEPMWSHVNFYEGETTYESSIEGATRGQRAIYCCTWYTREVCNGGHHQFFLNSTGMVWDDALIGFRLLGAVDYEEVLRSAVAWFPYSQPSKDHETRVTELDTISSSSFDALDRRLYHLIETNDIDVIFTTFILEHPDQFFR